MRQAHKRKLRKEMLPEMRRSLGSKKNQDLYGGLAQLARAPALHAGGHRFESVILHERDLQGEVIDMMDKQIFT